VWQLFFDPDESQIEALLARASPEQRALIVKLAKQVVD
jgi:hypothetical protein